MVNSWSLLYDEMYGPDDEANLIDSSTKESLIKDWKEEQLKQGKPMTDDATYITEYPTEYITGENANLYINANSPYNDGWTQQFYKEELERQMTDSRNKYHEKEILKDVEDYVSRTYNGHYTGTKHEYRNVQTIDLMASRDLASDFCQANILKYGSRYGSKDGRNKKDLMKVIHYAMLLLHFDEHYGKPSITSGNIDHNMP